MRRKQLFGLDHPDTLLSRDVLGMSLSAPQKKRLAVAQRLVTNVLGTRKRILGEELAYTPRSMNDLCKVLCERVVDPARLMPVLKPSSL